MSPQEAQALMDAAADGKLNLDSDGSQEGTGSKPADTSEDTNQKPNTEASGKPADQAADQEPPEGAPIASKSGAYTIPFEKLATARTERDTFKAQSETLAAENQQLRENLAAAQAAATARSDSGLAPTQADQNLAAAAAAAAGGKVDMAIFGDFSEEALAKGVATMVAQAEERANSQVDAKIAAALAPYKAKEAQTEVDAHMGAIYAKHPDANELAQSAEFAAWIAKQPAFAQAGIKQTMSDGTTKDVIEVFDNFKAATGKAAAPAPAAAPGVSKAVQEALDAAQDKPPNSLSELSGGAGMSESEHAMSLAGNPQALMDYVMSLPADRRERVLNRVGA